MLTGSVCPLSGGDPVGCLSLECEHVGRDWQPFLRSPAASPRAYPTWVEPRRRGVPRYGPPGLLGMRGILGRQKPIPHPEQRRSRVSKGTPRLRWRFQEKRTRSRWLLSQSGRAGSDPESPLRFVRGDASSRHGRTTPTMTHETRGVSLFHSARRASSNVTPGLDRNSERPRTGSSAPSTISSPA